MDVDPCDSCGENCCSEPNLKKIVGWRIKQNENGSEGGGAHEYINDFIGCAGHLEAY